MKRALTAAGVLAIAFIAAAFYQTAVNTVVVPAQTYSGIATIINGTSCANGGPGLQVLGDTGGGIYYDAGNGVLNLCRGGNKTFGIVNAGPQLISSGVLGVSSAGTGAASDTGLSRDAAGVWDMGTGAQASTAARVKAAGYISAGTTFTSNAGCTESALAGGATAGKFTVGQGTACTIVITMGNSATAPNGWNCAASDQTGVPAVAIRQTASNATSCSLLMTVTTSDVISFSAEGY